MFEQFKSTHYILAFGLVMIASYVGNGYKEKYLQYTNDEYEMIRKYLLNDSPLYGFNRPKIWIHSKYEINARNWKALRNTTDLNQPYLNITIQSIIDHCGDNFHICLIDDDSFGNLIPGWELNVSRMAEPMKSHCRDLGMMKLMYLYGGIVVPNSFVCSRNLKPLFGDNAFVCQEENQTTGLKGKWVPGMKFMGARKHDETIREFIEFLEKSNVMTDERRLKGTTQQWLSRAIDDGKMELVGGEKIGIRTKSGKSIGLEDIMEEKYLDLAGDCYGVLIPGADVLRRTKYQWFAVMSREELLGTNIAIVRYMKASMIDANDEYYRTNEIKSVVSL
jgi:hypothetical protein